MISNNNSKINYETTSLEEAKNQAQLIRENSMQKELLEGELLRVIYKDLGLIEELVLKSCILLDTSLLEELPNSESIVYNDNQHRDNLISMLDFDFSKIKAKVNPPLIIKSGKCKFCYPNNKTYGFYNTESDELIFSCVVDKTNSQNYIVMICENKEKSKLSKKSIENDIPF